jgi:hypothetical protein
MSLEGTPFANGQRLLIKNNKGLYIFINGSGRLYRVIKQGGAFNFIRLDSTVYFGYNVGSFAFSYNDSIFSLGGYGFWRVNGQLRVYIDTYKQWDIMKLNEEVPLLFDGRTDLIYYDYAAGRIYIGSSFERNEAVKTDSVDEAKRIYNVAFLDLKNKEWHHLGQLSNNIIEKVPLIKSLTSCPWGELITMGDKVILLDYSNNVLSSLNPLKETFILRGDRRHPPSSENIFFCKDSILYWSNNLTNELDSVALSRRDFDGTGRSIYTSNDPGIVAKTFPGNHWPAYLALVVFIVILSLTIIWYKKRGTGRSEESRENSMVNYEKQSDLNERQRNNLFDEKERLILQLLLENASRGSTTKVDEINKILGLTKKSIEIQKKQRSDIILSINRKYAFAKTNSSVILIQKSRTDFDKRSFEYFIEFSSINDLKTFMNI